MTRSHTSRAHKQQTQGQSNCSRVQLTLKDTRHQARPVFLCGGVVDAREPGRSRREVVGVDCRRRLREAPTTKGGRQRRQKARERMLLLKSQQYGRKREKKAEHGRCGRWRGRKRKGKRESEVEAALWRVCAKQAGENWAGAERASGENLPGGWIGRVGKAQPKAADPSAAIASVPGRPCPALRCSGGGTVLGCTVLYRHT